MGSEDHVRWIVQEMKDVNTRYTSGELSVKSTALMEAATSGHLGIVELLLEAGAHASLGVNDILGIRTALTNAAKLEAGHLTIVERLLEIDRNRGLSNSYTPGSAALTSAAEANHLHIVERLLQAGADANEENGSRIPPTTPLQIAAKHGHLLIVERLLQAKADVNFTGAYHNMNVTALMEAARAGHLLVVERLLRAGADVNIRSIAEGHGGSDSLEEKHSSALSLALRAGHHDISERLKEAGAVLARTIEARIAKDKEKYSRRKAARSCKASDEEDNSRRKTDWSSSYDTGSSDEDSSVA